MHSRRWKDLPRPHLTLRASTTLPQHLLRHVCPLLRWRRFHFPSSLLSMPPAGLEPATCCLEGSAGEGDRRRRRTTQPACRHGSRAISSAATVWLSRSWCGRLGQDWATRGPPAPQAAPGRRGRPRPAPSLMHTLRSRGCPRGWRGWGRPRVPLFACREEHVAGWARPCRRALPVIWKGTWGGTTGTQAPEPHRPQSHPVVLERFLKLQRRKPRKVHEFGRFLVRNLRGLALASERLRPGIRFRPRSAVEAPVWQRSHWHTLGSGTTRSLKYRSCPWSSFSIPQGKARSGPAYLFWRA
jgi:hypothetical protein